MSLPLNKGKFTLDKNGKVWYTIFKFKACIFTQKGRIIKLKRLGFEAVDMDDSESTMDDSVRFFMDAFKVAKKDIDFVKIHKVMKFLDWKYSSMTVPGVETLERTVDFLFDESLRNFMATNSDTSSSTGGFEVVLRSKGTLEIVFVLEEAVVDEEDIDEQSRSK